MVVFPSVMIPVIHIIFIKKRKKCPMIMYVLSIIMVIRNTKILHVTNQT
jgi:hypothetical protein